MADLEHWVQWHRPYADPRSSLSRRLRVVQRRLRQALDKAPEGPLRVISMCAGQGRDVIDVLSGHPRGTDTTVLLVELDPTLVSDARANATSAGLDAIEVVEADASTTSPYQSFVPADVVLVCGLFGNISDTDIERTVAELPRLCAAGATVIWTRHRRSPDFTPTIRAWFTDAGFDEIGFDTEPGVAFGVGTNRFTGAAAEPFRPGQHMFTFIGDGGDANH